MREPERLEDLLDPVGRNDRLDPELGDVLLPPALPDRRIRLLAAEERARSGRVPGAALVLADPARARLEDRVARRVERLGGHEPHELEHVRQLDGRRLRAGRHVLSICARWSVPE